MLAQHIKRRGGGRVIVQLAGMGGLQRGDAFDHLEPVCGHQPRLRGGVIAVIGAANALDQPLYILGRADLQHQIHIAPIDAQIQAARAHNRAQLALGHGGFHFFALGACQAAVMNADGQGRVIRHPEAVEKQLGLGAGVVKYQRGFVAVNFLHHRINGIGRAAARPWRGLGGGQHGNIGGWPGIGVDDVAALGGRGHHGGDGGGVLDRGRQAHPPQAWRQCLQARERQEQLVAPFAFGQGMDFIDHNALHIGKDFWRVWIADQQRQRFRRCQQNMGRVGALAALARLAGVAGAVLYADGQGHICHGLGQIARNIGRQRLERAYINCVQALVGATGQVCQRGQETCHGFPAPRGRDEQGSRRMGAGQHLALMRVHLPAAAAKPIVDGVWVIAHAPDLAHRGAQGNAKACRLCPAIAYRLAMAR